MKVGLIMVMVDGRYRVRITIGGVPQPLPCEKLIFTKVAEEDGIKKNRRKEYIFEHSGSRTRRLIKEVKYLAKKEAQLCGIPIDVVENLEG